MGGGFGLKKVALFVINIVCKACSDKWAPLPQQKIRSSNHWMK